MRYIAPGPIFTSMPRIKCIGGGKWSCSSTYNFTTIVGYGTDEIHAWNAWVCAWDGRVGR